MTREEANLKTARACVLTALGEIEGEAYLPLIKSDLIQAVKFLDMVAMGLKLAKAEETIRLFEEEKQ